MGMVTVKRFEFWQVGLNPTLGSEISKSRPCLVVSPDEANKFLNTVTVIPMTSTLKNYPTRFECLFEEKTGQLAIDQIRSVHKTRLIRKLGILDDEASRRLCFVLVETFKY
jgi:mRNA interferase MazF